MPIDPRPAQGARPQAEVVGAADQIDIVVSDEAATYRPEMQWLAAELGAGWDVAAAEELALIQKYLARQRISYPTAIASEGLAFDAYAVTAIPTMVFVDRSGRVAYVKTGSGTARQIRDMIAALLEEK